MDVNHLFQEVDEDLQRKKVEEWWKKNGSSVLTAALVIVLATALFNGWKSYRTYAEQKATGAVVALTEDKKLSEGDRIQKLESFARANPGISHAMIAKLKAAAAAIKDSKTDKAVAIYDEVAGDASVETPFRQLADLLAVQALMDTGDPAKLLTRLQPLMTPDGAWAPSARELAGHLALKTGDKDKARQYFRESSDDSSAPESVMLRAKDMLRSIGEGK